MKQNKLTTESTEGTKNRKSKAAKGKTPEAAAPVVAVVEPSVSFDLKQYTMVADCDAKADSLEVIRSAAYVLTDRAFALLKAGPEGTVRVVLQSKEPADEAALEALAKTFRDELATQRLRHQISKNNVSIREYIVEQAIRLAQQPPEDASTSPSTGPAAPPPEPELTEAQRQEIERLIAEVEEEIRAMAPQKAAADPLKISATWEETHAPKKD